MDKGVFMGFKNNKTRELKNIFSKALRDALRQNFGGMPSASIVAREFNLRSNHTNPITQETARRWMRGVSIPETLRLEVLANWLKLDLNEVFCITSCSTKLSFQIPLEWGSLNQREFELIINIGRLLLEHSQRTGF